MPATPVLSNGGTSRGLPISCFLNEANDSLEGIVGLWNENVWLAARGGGIGSYWGNLRSIGEKVGMNGKTSGVVPFIRVMDSPHAGHQPGLAAPRIGGLLPAGQPSRDRGIHRDPPPDRRRSQPQGAQSPPRASHLRRLHARGRERRGVGAGIAEGRRGAAQGLGPCALDPHPDGAHRDRRALPGVRRPREQRPARAPQARGPRGQDLEPVQRDHAADRHRPSRQAAHRRVLPELSQSRDLSRVARASDVHRGRDALPRQCAAELHRHRRQRLRPRHLRRHARAFGRPRRHGLPLVPAAERHPARSR